MSRLVAAVPSRLPKRLTCLKDLPRECWTHVAGPEIGWQRRAYISIGSATLVTSESLLDTGAGTAALGEPLLVFSLNTAAERGLTPESDERALEKLPMVEQKAQDLSHMKRKRTDIPSNDGEAAARIRDLHIHRRARLSTKRRRR